MEYVSSSQLTAHCVGYRTIDAIEEREHVVDARHDWLDNEQAPRVVQSEAARRITFEKSTIVRATIVAVLLIIVANLLQDAPIEAQPTSHRLTA